MYDIYIHDAYTHAYDIRIGKTAAEGGGSGGRRKGADEMSEGGKGNSDAAEEMSTKTPAQYALHALVAIVSQLQV